MQVTVNLPERYSSHDSAQLAQRIRTYAALLMFRSGELSAGAAAEFAGLDRFAFAAECGRHDIPLIDYPAEELLEDVEALRRQR